LIPIINCHSPKLKDTLSIIPFKDSEVQEVTQTIFQDEKLLKGMQTFLPTELYDYLLKTKNEVQSIYDFQSKLTYPFLMGIKKMSISEITISGIHNISNANKQLLISNHRDIVLDSSYLNTIFHENKIDTCEVAIGSNLVKNPITDYIFRVNRSFIVHREGNPRELYQHSLNLSNYILDKINSNEASIWIAQREGRAKDGNDRTQSGLLKMFTMSKKGDLVEHLKSLRITPVAISYEYDPCDLLKTQEFIAKQENPTFSKTFKQDLQNMLLGIQGQKGGLHYHFDKPLGEELNILNDIKKPKEKLNKLAELIDNSIHQNFRLNKINYIAFDLLNKNTTYSNQYSKVDFDKYQAIFNEKINSFEEKNQAAARNYLLGIYANPVINKFSV